MFTQMTLSKYSLIILSVVPILRGRWLAPPMSSRCYSRVSPALPPVSAWEDTEDHPPRTQQHGCSICGKVFSLLNSLTKHMKVHNGETECTLCGRVLNRKSYLKRHYLVVHGVQLSVWLNLRSTPLLMSSPHEQLIIPNKRASLFLYVSAWGVDVDASDGEKYEFPCPVCEKIFQHESTLNSHLKVHTGETRCTVCGKVLSRKADLRRHARSLHGILIV